MVQPKGQPCPNPGERQARLCPVGSWKFRKPEPGAQQGGSVLSRGCLFPRPSGSTAARCPLLPGETPTHTSCLQDGTEDCGKTLPKQERLCPSRPSASASLQMCLHELPLQQEWEKTASDGGYFGNCPPVTSTSLQLELLYQAPAHLFFSLFI